MIKNDGQLKRAQTRLGNIAFEIEEVQKKYSKYEQELYIVPLQQEQEELNEEITEYLELRDLPFENAMQGTLKKSTLIDNIGELLSKLRIAAKLTQAQMAAKLGWEQSNLSRFESENYSSQTVSKIVEFASTLGVWLHVTPSLTEKPKEVTYEIKIQPSSTFYPYGSTTSTRFDRKSLGGSIGSLSYYEEPPLNEELSVNKWPIPITPSGSKTVTKLSNIDVKELTPV